MTFKEVNIPITNALDLSEFKEMDYYAVEHYNLPIELMMENAGLQLAKLIAHCATDFQAKILIGIGNGNNGGGGLVAARRLSAWGYSVFLDLSTEITKEIPKRQLNRALKFGAKNKFIQNSDIWVDAYLGFSQRLPLPDYLLDKLDKANQSTSLLISLDIPTGFLGDNGKPFFKAQKILTLAAAKKLLYKIPYETEFYVADLGIPNVVYEKFNTKIPPFNKNTILKIRLDD